MYAEAVVKLAPVIPEIVLPINKNQMVGENARNK